MKFIVYNDVHLGSTYELNKLLPFEPSAILNGDIVDYQNCLEREVPSRFAMIMTLKALYGDRYILGNHELRAVPCKGFYKSNGVLFRHGDNEFWGKTKLDAYIKNASPGAGWLQRNIVARVIDWVRRIHTSRYSNEFLIRAATIAAVHECHTVVFGHKHPIKRTELLYNGIKIIVLPRGRNIVEV